MSLKTRGNDPPMERLDAVLRTRFWLESIPTPAVVVDEHFTIVAANREFERFCQPEVDSAVGLRIGEAVSCAHCVHPGACGTTDFCKECGAFAAVRRGLTHGAQARDVCRLLRRRDTGPEGFELEVTATHIEVDDAAFAVVTLRDVSPAARVALLERVFVHDLRNCLAGALGYAELLVDELGEGAPGATEARQLAASIENAAEAINAHSQLLAAENGRLVLVRKTIGADAILDSVRRTYARHTAAASREIRLGPSCGAEVDTDPRILARVLGNLLINALEACAPGEAVSMACAEEDDRVEFVVRNPAVIPADVQLQIFHRTFSTKGEPGRGIGTHAVKLFVERYLGGRVTFTSADGDGTAFTVSLARALPR